MESRRPKMKVKSLEMRVVFEPSRIAPLCVEHAYERVLPLARRGTTTGRDGRGAHRNETEQQRRPGMAR